MLTLVVLDVPLRYCYSTAQLCVLHALNESARQDMSASAIVARIVMDRASFPIGLRAQSTERNSHVVLGSKTKPAVLGLIGSSAGWSAEVGPIALALVSEYG